MADYESENNKRTAVSQIKTVSSLSIKGFVLDLFMQNSKAGL